MTASTDPAMGSPPVSHRVARAIVPGVPAVPGSPHRTAGGKTPAGAVRRAEAAALAGYISPAGPAIPLGRVPRPGRGDPAKTPPRPGQGEAPKAYWLVSLPLWPAAPAPADVLLNVRLNIPPVAASRPRVSPAEYTRIGGQKVKTKKAHAYNEKAYEDYKEKIGWLLKQAWGQERNDSDELGVYGIFHLPASAGTADGDNLLKAILDAGNGITWGDDRQFTRWAANVIRGSADPHTDLVVYVARRAEVEAAIGGDAA